MGRLACLEIPSFPLQLLLRRHPEWRDHPAAVVEHDKPQGRILWVNPPAARAGVLSGMRYAAGLSLTSSLRAAPISAEVLRASAQELRACLQTFTPEVEAVPDDPGAFWLNAEGFQRLQPDLERWGDDIRSGLGERQLMATVVIGWTRFGTRALARVHTGTVLLADLDQERRQSLQVPLHHLRLAPAARDTLKKLDILTVEDLLSLPATGLRARFGPEVWRLHQQASGHDPAPLQPLPLDEPLEETLELETPETDVTRLVFLISRGLHPLLTRLAARGQALAELTIHLGLEHAANRQERLRPATPVLAAPQILHLVLLRLEAARLEAPVDEVRLRVTPAPATPEQLLLFQEQPRRDLEAADRALARIRAELGEHSVLRATLREAHLPEARFRWEPLEHFSSPRAHEVASRPMIRRILARPRPLPPRPRHEPDGWLLGDLAAGPVVRTSGPYIVSGGWWQQRIHREYHFAEMHRGDVVWVYFDRRKRRWFLQGQVE